VADTGVEEGCNQKGKRRELPSGNSKDLNLGPKSIGKVQKEVIGYGILKRRGAL